MMSKFPHLFSPLKVGSHTYKNRVVAAPIYCGSFATIPGLDRVLRQSIEEKTRGGCAQVTIGETAVDFEYACREPFESIDYTRHEGPTFDAFREYTSIIKAEGAIGMIELSHCGESKLKLPGMKNKPIGPTAYTREDGVEIQAMDEEMMQAVCDNFVTSARFMQAAGFDGVVIHAGHGWLLHQFLSPRTNRRTDHYGGSLSNRARFPRRVIETVRKNLGPNFIIELRISGAEKMENGMELPETVDFCRLIEDLVDIIHVSVGVYRNPVMSGMFSSMYQPHGLNAGYAAAIKEAVSVPVTVVGGINTPQLAEELISGDQCDFVALARQLTADPDFANKALTGKEDDITPCTRCFKCFPGPLEEVLDELDTLLGCTVNPMFNYNNEELLKSSPRESKKVLVVGGGIGGMEAALTAAEQGHRVTLVEKSGALGGLLKFTDNDNYKTDLKAFKNLLIRRVRKAGITVELNKELTPPDLAHYNPDALILAVGAEPTDPPAGGTEHAINALDVYRKDEKIGKQVVVIGGGLVGCETGLHLAKSGHEVTVVEMMESPAPDAYPLHRMALIAEMKKMLTLKTGLKCLAIEDSGIRIANAENREDFLPADTVVYSVGMKPNLGDVEALKTAAGGIPVFVIGDCVRPAKVFEAMREGFEAGRSIL